MRQLIRQPLAFQEVLQVRRGKPTTWLRLIRIGAMKPVEHLFVSKTTVLQERHVVAPSREQDLVQTSFPVVSCWEVSMSLSLYSNSCVDILNDHSSIPPFAL